MIQNLSLLIKKEGVRDFRFNFLILANLPIVNIIVNLKSSNLKLKNLMGSIIKGKALRSGRGVND